MTLAWNSDQDVQNLATSMGIYAETLDATLEASSRRRTERELSLAEVALAEAMSAFGVPYVQQFPVGPYDADFYIDRARLCVEVDGAYHRERKEEDRRRDAYLAERRIATFRISAADVFGDPRNCARRICHVAGMRMAKLSTTEANASADNSRTMAA